MIIGKDILSVHSLSREDFEGLCSQATVYREQGYPRKALDGKIIANLFFEPSTRTRLSFATSAARLGASVIGFSGMEGTSMEKGESLEDTIRMVDGYADLIVMRHPEEGMVTRASEIASVPVINAGDGSMEHPTQTLIDLYAILLTQGRLDDLTVAIVGDLKYGRTAHSLAQGLSLFTNARQIWVAPKTLQMPAALAEDIQTRTTDVTITESLEEVLPDVDILYMTRVQKERFSTLQEYDRVKDVFILQPKYFAAARTNLRILHALPRRYEIPESIDQLPYAYYFQQARLAVPMRAALLASILQQ